MAQWMTIPEWEDIPLTHLLGREQGKLRAPAPNTPQNLHVLVRGEVTLPEGMWELRVSADDHYRLWLNGVYQGQGPVPSYPGTDSYDTYTVVGGKTVTVALHLYYQGLVNRVWNSGDGRFGLWLSVAGQSGELAACNESWRYQICHAYSGETTGYDTQFLENFDSRRYPEGWQNPAWEDSQWGNLVPAQWEPGTLLPRPINPLVEYELAPIEQTAIQGGILLDFGREITGSLTIDASGPAGKTVTIRCGEELEEGRVRWQMRCNCGYQETWTLGEGVSHLHPYDYKAFRYAEILFPETVKVKAVAAQVRHYPMEDACTLRCPEDELEDIFEICKNAVRCCTQEAYLDCPSREKGQYLGDALVTARSQVWLTGSTEMLRKCIRDFIASQAVSPTLMAVAPGSLMQEIADFSLLFPLLPLTDYAFTGDKTFLMECYPAVKTMTDGFQKYQRPDGLLQNVGELWNLVDWPENLRDGYDFPLTRPVVGEGCHNVINALWYGANQMREKIEKILGLPSTGRTNRIAAAFQRAFYREDRKLFADSEVSGHCSLHANIYPAYFGLLPEAAEDAYEALLLTPDRCAGAVPTYFALRSLGKLGRHETLYRLLTREDAYGWRNMLREGATASYEAWGKDQKWNTSLCHAWNSGPISLFIEEVVGLHPAPEAADGYRFEPPILSLRPDFTLYIPWRDCRLKISQIHGEMPCLERTNDHAVS